MWTIIGTFFSVVWDVIKTKVFGKPKTVDPTVAAVAQANAGAQASADVSHATEHDLNAKLANADLQTSASVDAIRRPGSMRNDQFAEVQRAIAAANDEPGVDSDNQADHKL